MLLKSLASSVLLLSSLSHLTAAACVCQSAGSSSGSASAVTSTTGSGAGSSVPSATGSDSAVPSGTSSALSPCESSSSTNNSTSGDSSGNLTASSKSSEGGASAPHFVIYSDKWDTNVVPDVSKVEGYNVVALSFLLSTGPADQAQAWAQLDASKKKEIKDKYKSAGIKIIVSAFGSTELPTTSGADPTKVANDMAKWVKDNSLDGIDVDYEDLGAMSNADGKAEEWLATFTKALRSQLPQGQFILTHAPVAPWFNSDTYKSGGYIKVNKDVGDMIDWYNIQFYNQNDYEDCDSLLTKSKTKTSLFEIAQAGVDQNKLVLGKPATAADASNGFLDPKTLATCVSQAKQKNWNGGVMVWQYPNADSSWIKTVRGDAFPVGN